MSKLKTTILLSYMNYYISETAGWKTIILMPCMYIIVKGFFFVFLAFAFVQNGCGDI